MKAPITPRLIRITAIVTGIMIKTYPQFRLPIAGEFRKSIISALLVRLGRRLGLGRRFRLRRGLGFLRARRFRAVSHVAAIPRVFDGIALVLCDALDATLESANGEEDKEEFH